MVCMLMALRWDVWGDGPGREARELASLHACIRGGYQDEEGEKS